MKNESMEDRQERDDLIREIEYCIRKLNITQLRRAAWYISRIWK